MLVTFKRGFRGRATNEQYFEAGEVAEFDAATVRSLLAEGAVDVVTVIEPAATPAPEPEPAPVVEPAKLKRRGAAAHRTRE